MNNKLFGILTILTLIFSFSALTGQNKSSFNDLFKKDKVINISTNNLDVGSLREMMVDPNGNLAFLDAQGCQVLVFDQEGNFTKRIGGQGEGPGEFILPTAVGKDTQGNIYVSDSRLRRINKYDKDGSYLHSFINSPDHWPPNIIRIGSKGHLFMDGLRADPKNRKTETWINAYGPEGKFVGSFLKRNTDQVWLRSIYPRFCFDLDGEDFIYGVQINDYEISKFDGDGNFLESIGRAPDYFVAPDRSLKIDYSKFKSQDEMRAAFTKISNSWTRIIRIEAIGDDYLLLIMEANGLVKGVAHKYIMDIWDLNGNLVEGAVSTDYRYLCCDDEDSLYFLIYTNEEQALEEPPKYTIGKYKLRRD